MPTLPTLPTPTPTHVPTAACLPGEYLAPGGAGCQPCEKGTFSPQPGAVGSCTVCSSGHFTSVTGSTQCSLCPEGTMLSDAGTDPSLHDDQADCSRCATSTFSVPARDECIGCLPGFAANGGSSCESCPAGRRADPILSLCVNCQVGKYALEASSETCEPCERPRTTLEERSTSW